MFSSVFPLQQRSIGGRRPGEYRQRGEHAQSARRALCCAERRAARRSLPRTSLDLLLPDISQKQGCGDHKFKDVSYRLSHAGLPIIDDALAWIDCELDAIHEAGDHFIVVGKVQSLAVEHPHQPLLFFKGGYGQFVPFLAETL